MVGTAVRPTSASRRVGGAPPLIGRSPTMGSPLWRATGSGTTATPSPCATRLSAWSIWLVRNAIRRRPPASGNNAAITVCKPR